MAEAPITTLHDLAEVIMGQSPSSEDCNTTGNGLPLLNGPTEFGLSHPRPVQFTTDARKRAQPNDILFCVRGSTTGRMNWADQEYAIGRGIAAIRHKNDPQSRYFLKGIIDHHLPSLLAAATGSTFPNVSKDQILGLEIKCFSPQQQRNISEILETIDKRINLNAAQNATLEAMAQAIFKSWFVDFDPVKAKAVGSQPEGMDAATAALFPSRLVESDLGLLPEGWAKKCLYNIADFNPSETIPKGHLAPYMDMAALPTTGCWPDTPIQRAFSSGTKFRNKDTLLARITPCLENGKTAYVMNLPPNIVGWGSTEFIVMRPKEREHSELIYILARTASFRAHAIQSMTGTSGRQRAQSDVVAAYQIALPPDNRIASEFSAIVSAFFEKIKENSQQNETLSLLRDTLLPHLISGKLRIEQMAGED